jgi:hypothetical protein
MFTLRWLPEFDSTFWTAFWPEAFAGLITGLVVGLVLLFSQLNAESRSDRRQSKLEWATIRGGVERAVLNPGSFSVIDINSTGMGRAEIESLLERQPLERWITDLELPELYALREYLRASDEVEHAGTNFMIRCSPLVATKTSDPEEQASIRKRLRLKARHAGSELIETFLGTQPQKIVDAANDIFMRDDVRAAHRRHKSSVIELANRRKALISALGLKEPAFEPVVLHPELAAIAEGGTDRKSPAG